MPVLYYRDPADGNYKPLTMGGGSGGPDEVTIDSVEPAVKTDLWVDTDDDTGYTPPPIPAGTIMLWGSASPPSGWGVCDGSALSRADNPVLFSLYGTSQGAGLLDGVTFSLPDMRDRTAVGAGGAYALGLTGGAATHTLTEAQIPSHTHSTAAMNTQVAWTSGQPHYAYQAPGVANTGATGGGAAHSIMQPYRALHYIIRLG